MVILSTLETLPTHIVTSPLASLRLVRSFCFKSPITATEPVSNTEGFAINTSKVRINNRGILDIHVIDVYFNSVYSNPSVFNTSSVAKISNSKRELQNK